MIVPGVRISSGSMLCVCLVPLMDTSPWMSTPPSESESESGEMWDVRGRWAAGCGLRMVMGMVEICGVRVFGRLWAPLGRYLGMMLCERAGYCFLYVCLLVVSWFGVVY